MTAEIPREWAPEAPKNTLLLKTRADLEKRWQEFDAATMQEARNSPQATLGSVFGIATEDRIRAGRDADGDFQVAKKAFEEAKSALSAISTDAQLKWILSAPGRLASTIQGFETHLKWLKDAERNLWYNRVLASTMADLTSLRAQMTENPADKREAEAALASIPRPPVAEVTPIPQSDIEWALTAWIPAVATTVSQISDSVVKSGLISKKWFNEKVKWWINDFENWISGLLPEGGIMDKVKQFFTAMKIQLGISTPTEKAVWLDLTETERVHGLRGAQKVFELLVKEKSIPDSDTYLQEYFTHPNIQWKSIKQLSKLLEEHKWNHSNLASALWFEQTHWDKVYAAIELLLSPKARWKMKSSGIQNAEDIPVGRLFSSVAKYADMLERVRAKGKDLDTKDLSFGDGFSWSNIAEFVWEKKEMLQALKERFTWFTPRVLNLLHTRYSTNTISDAQKFEASIAELDSKEQEFLQKTLPEFTKKLPFFVQSLAFGSEKNTKVLDAYMKNPGLNYADAIDLFVLSGGHTDLGLMNSFEKAQVIMRIFLMLRNSNVDDGYLYGAELAKAVLDDSKQMTLPPDVKIILKDITGLLTDMLEKSANEAFGMVKWIARSSPVFAASATALTLWALALAIQITPVWRVASTFVWIMTATGALAGFTALYTITNDGKIIDKNTWDVIADVEKIADEHRTPKA